MNDGILINSLTGEVITGAKYYTDSQINAIQQANWRESQMKQYGTFIWLLYNVGTALDWGLSPDTITKIIYLSTYMDYDNKLRYKRKLLTREKMQELLDVKKSTFYKFLSEVTEKKILVINDNGTCELSPKLFYKGKATNLKKSKMDFTRLYVNGVRVLYRLADPREHKALSYIFQAIPFTNYNYNMLCYNPKEPTLDNIKSMQFEEYCEIIGYSRANARRLKNIMKKFTVRDMPVFNFVTNTYGTFCYINPYVHYAGEKWEEVEVLGRFRAQDEDKSREERISEFEKIKAEIEQIKREIDASELY